MSDILIIKVNVFMRPKEMDNISRYIRDSMKTGLVILPPYCDAQVVPEGIEVQIDNSINDKMKGETNGC